MEPTPPPPAPPAPDKAIKAMGFPCTSEKIQNPFKKCGILKLLKFVTQYSLQ